MPNTAKLGIEITVDDKGLLKIKDLGPAAVKSGEQASKGFNKASSSLSGFGGIADEINTKIRDLGPLIAGYFGVQAAKGVVGLADEMLAMRGQVEAATDSAEEFSIVQKLLYDQSKESHSSLQANSDAYAALHLSLKDLPDAASTSLTVIDNLNKTLLKSNASTQDASSFWLQLKQSVSSANVQWEELGPMLEANRDFAVRLAEAFGTTTAGLKAMTSEGQLSGKQLVDAIKGMTDSINKDMGSVPLTIDRAKTDISNAFAKIISDADAADGGVSRIAEGVSGLADVIEQNAPAIQAMFSTLISGAEIAVKGVSALEGTFKAVTAASVGVYAGIVKVATAAMEMQQTVRSSLGLDTSESEASLKRLQIEYKAATSSANDLADQSNDAFKRMAGNIDKSSDAEEKYRAELKKNLADIEADKAAQKGRSDSTVAGIQAMTKAEQTMAKERARAIEEMYSLTGANSEEHFRLEAEKLKKQTDAWAEAGGDKLAIEQYLYDNITALSEEAWAAQDQASGEYLDSLTVNLKAVSKSVDDLDGKSAEVELTADKTDADSKITEVENKKDALESGSPVEVKIGADTSAFDEAASSVRSTLDGFTGGGGGVISVDMESVDALKEKIKQLAETPTLDPFGDVAARYEKQIEKINRINKFTDIETSSRRAVYEQKDHKERLDNIIEQKQEALAAAKERATLDAENNKKRIDNLLEQKREELDNAREIAEERLEIDKERISKQLEAEEDAMRKKDDILSAYKKMAGDTESLKDLTYFKFEADALARQGQEWQDMGIDRVRIQTWLTDELKDLSAEAAEAGVGDLGSYNDSLLKSAQQTGNFSDDMAKANERIGGLKDELERLNETNPDDLLTGQIAQFEGLEAAADAAAEKLRGVKDQFKIEEDEIASLEKASKMASKYLETLQQSLSAIEKSTAALDDQKTISGVFGTNSLSKNFGAVLGPSSLSKRFSFDGGGYTGPGSRSGGIDGRGGFPAILHPQETVIDHTKQQTNNNSSSSVVNNNITINVTQPMTPNQIIDIAEKTKLLNRRTIQ